MPPVVASDRSAPEQNTRPDDRTSTTLTVVVRLGRRHEPLEQLGHQLPRQRVAVVRRVQGDRRDRVGDVEVDELRHGGRSVRHGSCRIMACRSGIGRRPRRCHDPRPWPTTRSSPSGSAGCMPERTPVDRAEDVRRPRLPRRRPHGGRRERQGRADGALRPGRHRAATSASRRQPVRDARQGDGRLAPRRRPRPWPTTTTLARWVEVGTAYAAEPPAQVGRPLRAHRLRT